MFEKLLRELNNLHSQTQISVPINTDSEGYLDRECPAQNCLFTFKVYSDDWSHKVSDHVAHCPMCGHEAPKSSWFTTEQIEKAKEQAVQHIRGRLGEALRQDATHFNRSFPRDGFITMTAKVNASPSHYIIPISAKARMQQKITCAKCDVNYAVIGSAFFCPCCGHNSAEETFNSTIRLIEGTFANLPVIRRSLSKLSLDQAENTCRTLIEKGLLDCVVAFQRFCEVVYNGHPHKEAKIPVNAFQKLDVGANLWNRLFGESYETWLTNYQLERLTILFQRRHLLQHKQGMVDEKYLEKTTDTVYKMGQRIVLSSKDVVELIGYITLIVQKLKEQTTKTQK